VIAARRAVCGVPFSEGEAAQHDKEQRMNVFGEPWTTRHARYFSDPDAGPEALLNDATEWLHYAHTNLQLLTELIHDRGALNERRLTMMLEGIAAFIEMGTRSATQAHLRMQWRQVRQEAERLASTA
jgi:hypothetical protein